MDIWKNRKLILEGISNTINKKDFIEEVAKERLEHCNKCEHRSEKNSDCLVPGTTPCCKICGCCLKFKIRSMSSVCPHPIKPLWGAVLSEEEESKHEMYYDEE